MRSVYAELMNWRPSKLTRMQMEERRLEAARRFEDPHHVQKDLAHDLGVHPNTISLWKQRWRTQGIKGLLRTVSSGRPKRPFDPLRFEEDLERGAKHFGYPTESWTSKRLTEMLFLTQGLRFHPQHFRKRVRSLGFSPQKAAVQSRERNLEQIDQWTREKLPELRKALQQGATLVVCDEVGSSLKTLRGITWAKRGKTPILPTHGHWDNLSIIGGMTPCGKVFQQCYKHAIRAMQVVKFFKHLLQHLEGPLVVLLDNARIHRARVVQEFLSGELGQRMRVFHTPPYAPEFNPIEWLWAWIKRARIRNLCPKSLMELKHAWTLGFRQVRSRSELVRSFFRASNLCDIC